MVDMSLPPVVNSAVCEIVLNLSSARALYNLATATFRVRVADAPGGQVRYEWL